MATIADTILADAPRDRLALLLQHFSELEDTREPWRVMYPLSEVLLLVVCATIAACDDFDEIVAWGRHHLDFVRRFSPCHHGIPCERWLRTLLNRVDPILFKRCFEGWVAEMWPDRPDFSKTTVEEGHGRIETRTFTASAHVDWIGSDRRYPGEPRFARIRIPCRAAASAMRGALAPSAVRLSCSGRPGSMASARCGSAATSHRPPPKRGMGAGVRAAAGLIAPGSRRVTSRHATRALSAATSALRGRT